MTLAPRLASRASARRSRIESRLARGVQPNSRAARSAKSAGICSPREYLKNRKHPGPFPAAPMAQHPACRLGCALARCGSARMQAAINRAIRPEESGRDRSKPPCATGLVSKSPKVAPSGRVRIKAAQNKIARDAEVVL